MACGPLVEAGRTKRAYRFNGLYSQSNFDRPFEVPLNSHVPSHIIMTGEPLVETGEPPLSPQCALVPDGVHGHRELAIPLETEVHEHDTEFSLRFCSPANQFRHAAIKFSRPHDIELDLFDRHKIADLIVD